MANASSRSRSKLAVKHTKGKRKDVKVEKVKELPSSCINRDMLMQPAHEVRITESFSNRINCKVSPSLPMDANEVCKTMKERVVETHSIIVRDCWPKELDIYPCAPVLASLTAHQLYDVWMPERKITLLIMAESPTPTFPTWVIGTKLIDPTGLLPAEMVEAGHINVIHQLSYGEIELLPAEVRARLSDAERNAIRGGTPQFWKLMCTLAGKLDVQHGTDGTDPLFNKSALQRRLQTLGIMKSNNTTLADRIRAKVDIIISLKRRGILLIDSSVHPLYKGYTC